MQFFLKTFLLCLALIINQKIWAQNIYQKVDIPVGNSFTQEELEDNIRKQYPVLGNSELQLTHEIHSPGGVHYTFSQAFQGIPVYEAGIKVNLMPKDRITSFLSTLKPLPAQKFTNFSYSQTAISQRMAEVWGAYEITINSFLFIKENQLIPVYQTIIHTYGTISSLEFIIDARTGEELLQKDRGTYFHKTDADTNGRARVFLPNPCTKGKVKYGDLFIDSMDFHKPIFENFIDTVILKDITFEDNTFKLIGPYVNITDRSPFFIAPATSSNGDFFFTRDQSGFEDVMAYYHIDSMQRYVQKLGFINLQNGPMQIDPHGKSDLDQSVFIGNGGNSYILFGDGGVDDAEDADVLVHEYAHALSYDAAPETNSGTERRGLDEGIGDYFAAIYSFDSDSVYGWDKIFNWDGHNEFWNGRKAISHIQYPPSSTSIYTYGEIWASALMEIRQELGKEVADRLAIQEMYGNFAQMTLTDAAMLYLDAELALYGGIHSEMISFTFCEKGILSGPDCINVTLEKELASKPSLSVFPVPAEGQLTLSWSRPITSSAARLEIVNLLGQTVFHLPLSDFEGELSFAPNLSSGVYIALLIIDEKRATRQKIQIK